MITYNPDVRTPKGSELETEGHVKRREATTGCMGGWSGRWKELASVSETPKEPKAGEIGARYVHESEFKPE